MNATKLERAEQDRKEAELVRTMTTKLRALLDGRVTRAEVTEWTRKLWPPDGGQGSPFKSGAAASVFDSIYALDARWGDDLLVRDADIRAYVRWLTEGESFRADDDSVVVLARELEEFAAAVGSETIRWWLAGIGWCAEVRFCAPARQRPFIARSHLDYPGAMGISKQSCDDWYPAIVDLFEALAIDDGDCARINPEIDLSRLPIWTLRRQDDNGNSFEVARFRSYAKACAQAEIFTTRGHKQLYWVDPT